MKLKVLYDIVQTIAAIFTVQIFSLKWSKWFLFTISIVRAKGVFYNLNLKMMKIINKVNFLEPYFLITNRPPNINIPSKYANLI